MKSRLYLLILLCLGCETVVEVSPPEYDSEPVVTSFFSPDSMWSVSMHRSLGATVKRDVTREFIADASVRITDGSNTVDILNYQGNGRYISSKGELPTNGIQYTLRVDFPSKPSIQATSSAPSPVVISDYSIEYRPPESDIIPTSRNHLRIVFSDAPGMNFYRIGVYRRVKASQLATGEVVPDSIYESIWVEDFSPGWSCGYFADDVADVDPTDVGGVSGGVLCEEFVVTDRLFDGKDYSWSGTTLGGSDGRGRKEFRLIISSLSEDYYRYLQSLERNVFHDPLTQEPIPMYSNVSGGLGVFAGYTNTNLILPIPSDN